MRLLLTGASGFTGIHLAKAAREVGYTVIELEGDLCDKVSVVKQIAQNKPTHAIHLAGISQVTGKDELDYYKTNLLGSLNVLNGLAELELVPQKVILASSANVYGNNPHSPIRESEPPSPISHYAMSKLAMEYLSKPFLDRLRIVIARPFNYTGVGHAEYFVIPKIITHFQLKAKTIELGNVDVFREYNDVRDVCQMYLALLQKGNSGETYNLATGREYALREVIAILEELSGHQLDVKVNPAFLRANEIDRLCGDPTRLIGSIGEQQYRHLEETLEWMLQSQMMNN
jgi:nucleoside-diphosphate-sugar epimerase